MKGMLPRFLRALLHVQLKIPYGKTVIVLERSRAATDVFAQLGLDHRYLTKWDLANLREIQDLGPPNVVDQHILLKVKPEAMLALETIDRISASLPIGHGPKLSPQSELRSTVRGVFIAGLVSVRFRCGSHVFYRGGARLGNRRGWYPSCYCPNARPQSSTGRGVIALEPRPPTGRGGRRPWRRRGGRGGGRPRWG